MRKKYQIVNRKKNCYKYSYQQYATSYINSKQTFEKLHLNQHFIYVLLKKTHQQHWAIQQGKSLFYVEVKNVFKNLVTAQAFSPPLETIRIKHSNDLVLLPK